MALLYFVQEYTPFRLTLYTGHVKRKVETHVLNRSVAFALMISYVKR